MNCYQGMQARVLLIRDEFNEEERVLVVERGDASADYDRATVAMPARCGVHADEVGLLWENGERALLPAAKLLLNWLSTDVPFTNDEAHRDTLLRSLEGIE